MASTATIAKNVVTQSSFANLPGRADADGLSRRLMVQNRFRVIDPLAAYRHPRRARS
jgi:hypothetical protein